MWSRSPRSFSLLSHAEISGRQLRFNDIISSWKITRDTTPGSQTWYLEITRHEKCLDLSEGDTANGANIQQWACQNGNGNQRFALKMY